MHIGNIDAFLESITIASASSKLLRKRFLHTDTIELIPNGGYTCNINSSKKALIWLLHMEEMDSVKRMHCRNSREHRLPELPRFSVDGYCPKAHKSRSSLAASIPATRASRSVTTPP